MEDSQVKPLVTSKDLMIGNLLDVLNESGYISPDTGYNWEVVEILRDGVMAISSDKREIKHYPFERLSPITLTEDWLKLCGIEKVSFRGLSLELDDMYLTWKDHKLCVQFFTDDLGECNIDLSHIKYLNQFQNIYNLLTNKELTIKEVI